MKRSFALIASALFLASCSSNSQPATATSAGTNPYTMESTTIPVGVIPAGVIHDTQRSKDVQVSIEYPTHGGPYPVVIFSHEYGAPENAYVGLSAFWASHGYVVIKPRHADFGAIKEPALQPFPAEPMESRRGRRNQPSATQQQQRPFRPDPAELWTSQTPSDWTNRVADIKLVMDSIPQLVQQYPEIKERVDATKIGVAGHSYGAFTAMLIGGVRTFAGANAVSYADPRVKAIEAMSPQGPSTERGLTRDSYATLHVPTLFLTGSMDYGATQAEDPAWRRETFELSPAGDKWFVNVMGVGPSAFTGRFGSPEYIPSTPAPYPSSRPGPGGTPVPPMAEPNRPAPGNFRALGQANTVRTVSLSFWDAYLKNDTTGRNYLNGLVTRSDMQAATK